MRPRSAIVALPLVLFLTAASYAKDICVKDQYGIHYIFNRVRALRPGKAVALTGTYHPGDQSCPLTGSAVLTTGNQLRVALFVHCMAPIGSNNFTVAAVGTPDFNVAGDFDNNGDYEENNGGTGYTLSPLDCATVPVP